MGLDLNKLEHLIAVAEEGSFTRAASRLHLTQQALSTSIRTLEREVGVQLLDRGSTGLTVLPAGRALIEDARVLRGMAHLAVRRARHIGREESEALRIGHTPAVTADEISVLLARARRAHPDLAPQVNQRYPDELAEQLLAGDLDVGLCRAMQPPRGLTRTLLTRHRLRVAVATDHHLAHHGTVSLTDLSDENIMVWGRPGRSDYTDLLIRYCRDAGFEPRVERNPVQGTPPVTAVLDTGLVAFVTSPPGPAADGAVRVLELEPPLFVPLHALWHGHSSSDAREAFVSTFTE
ncbi:LysR family transcriptional regulator [Nocardiopsis salina]|uniref:LysR substrate-binding domain-containing protein n=1 Tax=Nocardiopsis salina TaxID=245836 RepID=UPI00034AC058|nr:LysR substrate-binding domain-containing protein [Nocardiopsis salina]